MFLSKKRRIDNRREQKQRNRDFFEHAAIRGLRGTILVDRLDDDKSYETYLSNARAMNAAAKTKAQPFVVDVDQEQHDVTSFALHRIGNTNYALLPKPTKHRASNQVCELLGAVVFAVDAFQRYRIRPALQPHSIPHLSLACISHQCFSYLLSTGQ